MVKISTWKDNPNRRDPLDTAMQLYSLYNSLSSKSSTPTTPPEAPASQPGELIQGNTEMEASPIKSQALPPQRGLLDFSDAEIKQAAMLRRRARNV